MQTLQLSAVAFDLPLSFANRSGIIGFQFNDYAFLDVHGVRLFAAGKPLLFLEAGAIVLLRMGFPTPLSRC